MVSDSDLVASRRRPRALLIAFALASVAVLASGVFAYRAARQFADSSRLVQHAYAALDSIQEIELRKQQGEICGEFRHKGALCSY